MFDDNVTNLDGYGSIGERYSAETYGAFIDIIKKNNVTYFGSPNPTSSMIMFSDDD